MCIRDSPRPAYRPNQRYGAVVGAPGLQHTAGASPPGVPGKKVFTMELRTLELRKPVAILALSTAALFGTATAATATSPSPSPTTTVTQEDDNDDNTGLWGLAGLLGLLGLAGLRGGKRRDHVDHVTHDRRRTDHVNSTDTLNLSLIHI